MIPFPCPWQSVSLKLRILLSWLLVFSKLHSFPVFFTFGCNSFCSYVYSLVAKWVQRNLIYLKFRSPWFLISCKRLKKKELKSKKIMNETNSNLFNFIIENHWSDQDWYTLPSILNETDNTSWTYKKWHIVLSVTGCT